MSFVIVTDTSANLPTPEANEYGITVVPLSYSIDGEAHECLNTEDFQYNAYYEAMKSGTVITTSQINPQKYMDNIAPLLKEGNDILFVGMASGISGSYNSMLIAKDQLLEEYPERKICLVDSMGASLGEGLLVLEANRCKQQGMSLEDTAEKLLKLRKRMYQIFTVDDLMHLRKGGRLSNAAAFVGALLHIKPLLKGNEEGKIVSFEKVRGRKAVISQMARKYEQLVVDPENQMVGISQCNCMEDAQRLAELLKQNRPPKEIKIVDHEPVTGSYLGSGALALYFLGDEDVRQK